MNENENMDFLDEDIDLEEDEDPVEPYEKPKFKEVFKSWCKEHDSSIIKGILSGIFGLFGIILSYILNRRENDSYVYTNDQNGNVYRFQAKEMKTSKIYANEDIVGEKKKKRK